MSEDARKLTVLMSVYNGLPYLKEAVKSILDQTLQEFTFLIINDGSTDGSTEYLESITDPRVEIIHQENQGLGAALNRGLKLVDSKYVARMDADDIAFPERLQKQVNFLDKHPDVGMVGCGFAFTIDGVSYQAISPLPTNHNDIYSILKTGSHAISHPTVCLRMNIVNKVGGYRVPGGGQEWDFFLRIAELSKLANIDEVLQLYRMELKSDEFGSRMHRLKGQAYALHASKSRNLDKKEISFYDYDEVWNSRPIYLKVKTYMKCLSSVNYNYYLFNKLNGNTTKSLTHLIIAVLTNPAKVTTFIKKKQRSKA